MKQEIQDRVAEFKNYIEKEGYGMFFVLLPEAEEAGLVSIHGITQNICPKLLSAFDKVSARMTQGKSRIVLTKYLPPEIQEFMEKTYQEMIQPENQHKY